jgi:hypothetical protein
MIKQKKVKKMWLKEKWLEKKIKETVYFVDLGLMMHVG